VQIKNRRDFYAGIMFFLFGVGFLALSMQYQMGTAAKMGPAYFPAVLGGMLAILGAIIIFGSATTKAAVQTVEKFDLGLSGYIIISIVLFGIALNYLGFVAALIVLILVSSKASHEFSLRDSMISMVVLAIASYLIFIKGLQLQMPVWPKFLGL
jgi:Tripartite tricarboxylate transporter TctB family